MKTSFKSAKTIKEYKTNISGWEIVIPVGSIVSNKTAGGNSDDYRFWTDFKGYAEKLTGYRESMLSHDLTYYGVNVPAEFCEPYKKN